MDDQYQIPASKLAQFFGCTTATISNKCKQGFYDSKKIGNRWYVSNEQWNSITGGAWNPQQDASDPSEVDYNLATGGGNGQGQFSSIIEHIKSHSGAGHSSVSIGVEKDGNFLFTTEEDASQFSLNRFKEDLKHSHGPGHYRLRIEDSQTKKAIPYDLRIGEDEDFEDLPRRKLFGAPFGKEKEEKKESTADTIQAIQSFQQDSNQNLMSFFHSQLELIKQQQESREEEHKREMKEMRERYDQELKQQREKLEHERKLQEEKMKEERERHERILEKDQERQNKFFENMMNLETKREQEHKEFLSKQEQFIQKMREKDEEVAKEKFQLVNEHLQEKKEMIQSQEQNQQQQQMPWWGHLLSSISDKVDKTVDRIASTDSGRITNTGGQQQALSGSVQNVNTNEKGENMGLEALKSEQNRFLWDELNTYIDACKEGEVPLDYLFEFLHQNGLIQLFGMISIPRPTSELLVKQWGQYFPDDFVEKIQTEHGQRFYKKFRQILLEEVGGSPEDNGSSGNEETSSSTDETENS